MRRRIGGAFTGLGNSSPSLMNGDSTGSPKRDALVNECARDCYETFFMGTMMDYDLCDAQANDFEVRLGIEPSYFGENLRMIELRQEKYLSNYQTGHAFGYWGSGIRAKKRYYADYKYASKFTRFVDKWHPLLFPLAKA